MPLLSNMLGYSVTPYPMDFGIAGDTFDLTINGISPSINTVTKAYNTVYIKSNSELQFSYVSTFRISSQTGHSNLVGRAL